MAEFLRQEVYRHDGIAYHSKKRDRLDATYGLATTGVAGPDPQDGKAPGTVHVALAGPAGMRAHELSLQGDRDLVRARAVAASLELLRRELVSPRLESAP